MAENSPKCMIATAGLAAKALTLTALAKNKNISLAAAKEADNLHDIFHLPLSAQVYAQYLELQESLQNLDLSQGENDIGLIFEVPPTINPPRLIIF